MITNEYLININYNISETISSEYRELLIVQEIERLENEEQEKYPLKNRILELAIYQR